MGAGKTRRSKREEGFIAQTSRDGAEILAALGMTDLKTKKKR